jgi:hypothetical protein
MRRRSPVFNRLNGIRIEQLRIKGVLLGELQTVERNIQRFLEYRVGNWHGYATVSSQMVHWLKRQ